jgi:hypothetical protein
MGAAAVPGDDCRQWSFDDRDNPQFNPKTVSRRCFIQADPIQLSRVPAAERQPPRMRLETFE